MAKLKIVVDKRCPNCKYIIKTLIKAIERIPDIEQCIEITLKKDDRIEAVPAIITPDGEIDYLMGNIYGAIKLFMYLKIYCFGEKRNG
ncbi:MAG: hypothetical protein QXE70_10350 [Ignisphaera sp.]